MSKEKLAERLSRIEFKEESKGFRKKLSVIILIAIILGYLFLVLFNVFVAVSAYGIRVKPKNFDRASVDNETIGIKGDIIIRNDHWYSLDINDLSFEMKIYTEDGTKIKDKKKVINVIPRLKNKIVELDFTFSLNDLDPDSLPTYIELANSDHLDIKFEVSVRYTIYIMTFEIEVEADIED